MKICGLPDSEHAMYMVVISQFGNCLYFGAFLYVMGVQETSCGRRDYKCMVLVVSSRSKIHVFLQICKW